MLRIEIVNDGTANIPKNIAHPPGREPYNSIGNYDFRVFINDELVSEGRIERHVRMTGWEGLLSCLNKEVNGDRFEF